MMDDGINLPGTISRARFEEMNMDYFRNPMGPVEKAMRDYGVDMRNVHDGVMVGVLLLLLLFLIEMPTRSWGVSWVP